MSAAFMSEEETQKEMETSLLTGWVHVTGDHDLVEWLEKKVYTPGTPANADFVAIIGPCLIQGVRKIRFIFLARKTSKLRECLSQFQDGQTLTDAMFERAVEITFAKSGDMIRVTVLQAIGAQPAEDVKRLVSKMFRTVP